MLYPEYEDFRIEYLETQRFYQRLLNEKERLWMMTQPKASRIGGDKISGSSPMNEMDEYLIAMEAKRIEERVAEYKEILDAKTELLKQKRQDLLDSTAIEDRIYCLRYFDRLKISAIARKVHFSDSSVYRILMKIRNNLKVERF